MSQPEGEFAFPRYVQEAVGHDHKFLTQSLQIAGWDKIAVDQEISAEQEKNLFMSMQVAGYLANQHRGKKTPLTKKGREYHALYRQIFEHMVQRNLGLIYKMVSYSHAYLPNMQDLEAEAFYVLFNAVRNFNPWKGFRFSTYACNAIRNACWQMAGKYARSLQQRQTVAVGEESKLYDPNIGEDNPRDLIEVFMSRATCLNETEKHVLKERYLTGRVKTLREIGSKMGISKERVRQIQNAAILKVQEVVTHSDY